MSYVFEVDRLGRIAETGRDGFLAARPYPHIVIDDFLRAESALCLSREFPRFDALAWDHYAAPGLEVKLGSSREEDFPEPHRRAIHDLNSGVFVRFLERLTGIEPLLTDPHLCGGGLHMTRESGVLGVHADFNWHEKLRLHRRLNLLVYLTPWQPEYGGELELWDAGARHMERRIEPIFNRAVLFTTRSDTFHGHPRPWAAPRHIDRCSIAMYYYTAERPAEEIRAPHNTLYKGVHL